MLAHLRAVHELEASASWSLSKPAPHVIDREADSVDHPRRWDAAAHQFLVRGDDRRVRWKGVPQLLREIAVKLRRKQAFQHVGEALFQGPQAQLWVAETEVVLDRPAKKHVRNRRFQLAEQETGPAIARRLLVAAMACVIVWGLHHDESPRAVELKRILVRLSGRQMKRHKPYTMPALLAGPWTLLSMLALLEQCNLQKIRTLAAQIPFLNTA